MYLENTNIDISVSAIWISVSAISVLVVADMEIVAGTAGTPAEPFSHE
jgi:hypothetical protein